MSNNKLGRGLSILLGDDKTEQNEKKNKEYEYIQLSQITTNVNQPRKFFSAQSLQELQESIQEHGVINPIIVKKTNLSYEIIAGERRYRAAKQAGLHQIPVIIKSLSEEDALILSIIENIQRDDLTLLEEAKSYQDLITKCNYTHEECGKKLGKSRSHISNIIRLLSLPKSIQELIHQKKISMGHARALINHSNPLPWAKQSIKNQWSVRQLERALNDKEQTTNSKTHHEPTEDIILLEQQLSQNLGITVNIHHKNDKGSIVCQYEDLMQMDLIMQKLQQ